ncbi:MAG: hypothetical protein NTV06_06775, partial [candidate division Zixibacteria bacterium]|nr:hypothetical protein [candidate division Zixibacteria bacterium]
ALWTEAPSAEKYPLGARLDEISPDQSDTNKIMVYMEWRRKAEYYQAKYSALISHTYTVDTLDDRRGLSADSLKMIVMEIAGIYYHIGLLSEEKAEKEAMLDSLKSMGTKVDSNSYRQIEDFISSLKSTFK